MTTWSKYPQNMHQPGTERECKFSNCVKSLSFEIYLLAPNSTSNDKKT